MSGKAKVLIVENEMPLAMLMINVLCRLGFDVEFAANGKKALAIATQKRFDLITLDIKLPDMTGFEICSELKQRHISYKTPILFITASPSPEDIAEAKRRGAEDYMTKPFDVTDFVYRVTLFAKVKSAPQTSDALKKNPNANK
jgi:DNA-binding response OmpR family regulator